jgi:hypothetical protein
MIAIVRRVSDRPFVKAPILSHSNPRGSQARIPTPRLAAGFSIPPCPTSTLVEYFGHRHRKRSCDCRRVPLRSTRRQWSWVEYEKWHYVWGQVTIKGWAFAISWDIRPRLHASQREEVAVSCLSDWVSPVNPQKICVLAIYPGFTKNVFALH